MESTQNKYGRWKKAYDIYVNEKFSDSEKKIISRKLILTAMEIVNEAIITNNKQIFRQNKYFIYIVKLLLSEKIKFTSIEQNIIKNTLENYKIYCILKVQGFKE